MRNVYPVFFTKTNDNVLVEVPDLDILTEGKDMNDAIDMARDAIELKCVSMEDKKEEINIICNQIVDLALLANKELNADELDLFIKRSNSLMSKVIDL